MNGSVVLASGVEASRLGSTRAGRERGGGRRVGNRPGVERGKGLSARVELQERRSSTSETVIVTLVQS